MYQENHAMPRVIRRLFHLEFPDDLIGADRCFFVTR